MHHRTSDHYVYMRLTKRNRGERRKARETDQCQTTSAPNVRETVTP